MNVTDLRDVLEERSSTDRIESRPHLTLSGVRHRLVIRRRRRRIAATAAAAVVVLAVGAGSWVIGGTPRKAPPEKDATVAAPATINGFPEYASGARVIASATLVPPAKTLRLAFVPSSATLSVFLRCAPGSEEVYELAINGRQISQGTGCSTVFTVNTSGANAKYAVRLGRSSTLTATFPAGAPAGFAMAIGQQVPVEQYVFPPRPATLNPLNTAEDMSASGEDQLDYYTTTMLRSDPADPNRPVSRTLTWDKGVHLLMRSQTPGALTLSIDGVEVSSGQWWDYEQGLVDGGSDEYWPAAAKRKRGTTFTLTITPERMTGDWAVAFQEPN